MMGFYLKRSGGGTTNGSVINGFVINGVANFYQDSAPTVRADSSALEDNDRWYDSSTGKQWTRRGIYWIGELKSGSTSHSSVNYTRGAELPIGLTKFFVESIGVQLRYDQAVGIDADPTNYRNINVLSMNFNGISTTLFTIDSRNTLLRSNTAFWVGVKVAVNTFYDFGVTAASPTTNIYHSIVNVGSPTGAFTPAIIFYWREVAS